MGLFYAYLKDDGDDSYRHLIAFADRETADKWWRMISTPPSPYASNVRRSSPQIYIQNNPTGNSVAAFFKHPRFPDAKPFYRNMLITALFYNNGSNPSTIPPVTFTDHISGRWYFIRSKADPLSHWYLRIKGTCLVCGHEDCDAIHVSSEHRTRFCIRVRNPAADLLAHKDLVMIGKDELIISARKGYIIHTGDGEDMRATKGYEGGTDFLFSDFKDRFIAHAEKRVNGEIWEYVESVEKGSGEPWELVD